MQTVSEAARALVDGYAKIMLRIYIEGEALAAGIGVSTYTPSCGSSDSFSFGNACSAGFTAVVAAPLPQLRGKDIQVTWDVEGLEYPLLSGVVETSTVSAGRTTIEAYDSMYRKGAIPFVAPEALMTTCTGADVLRELARIMDVIIHPDTLTAAEDVTISAGLSKLDTEASCSMVAGYVAGIMGGNALFDRSGLFCVRGYMDTGWETHPYEGGAEADNADYTVTGITIRREETVTVTNPDGSTSEEQGTEEFFAGDGSLALENPLADQAAADRAFAALSGVTVRPGKYSFPGGLLLEPGDIFTVHSMDCSYPVAAVDMTITLDGGCKTDVTCGGEVQTGGCIGQINQAMQTLMADIARVKTLVAENAKIGSANIQRITTETISGEHGWINLKDGTFAYQNPETGKGISWDGSVLKIGGYLSGEDYLLPDSDMIDGGMIDVVTLFAKNITATSNFQVDNQFWKLTAGDDGVKIESADGNTYVMLADESGTIACENFGTSCQINMSEALVGGHGSMVVRSVMQSSPIGMEIVVDPYQIDVNQVGDWEIPGVLGTVNINADTRVMSLKIGGEPVADHIIETGSDDTYTYEKYASGTMRICGAYPLSEACTTAFGAASGWYRTSGITPPNYPVAFFEAPVLSIDWRSEVDGYGAFVWRSDKGRTDRPPSVNVVRPGSVSSLSGYLEIMAVGKWK